ncbi:hypothetical protein RUND412_010598 [Rhizina undulata]
MRSTFSSRRPKARKITHDDSDHESTDDVAAPSTTSKPPKPKSKKRATPKLSFPSAVTSLEENPEPEFTIKKSALSRKAAERNALKKSALAAGVVGMERLNIVAQERPSYTAEELETLRNATSVPEDISEGMVVVYDDDTMMDYTPATPETTRVEVELEPEAEQARIPSAAEINIMKAQRSAKAFFENTPKEGSNFSDNDDEILLTTKKSKKKGSRLARDPLDEDEADAYDASDPLLLSQDPKLLKAAAKNRKQNIQATIADAENSDSDASGKSLDAWERSQIRKGVFAENGPGELESLSRQPEIIAPLPNLVDAVQRLEGMLAAMVVRKDRSEKMWTDLVEERKEIAEREGMVQEELRRAGEQYEELRKRVGLAGVESDGFGRGLESFGNTPVKVEEES